MKRAFKNSMNVQICGVDLDVVTKIEFLFKMHTSPVSPATKLLTYIKNSPESEVDEPEDVSEGELKKYLFTLPWSKEDTLKFRNGSPFYLDVRITLTSGDNPTTTIVALTMEPSLFDS